MINFLFISYCTVQIKYKCSCCPLCSKTSIEVHISLEQSSCLNSDRKCTLIIEISTAINCEKFVQELSYVSDRVLDSYYDE